MAVLTWLQANLPMILGVIVALDTALAQIPSVEANSTFQLLAGYLAKFAAFFAPPKAP